MPSKHRNKDFESGGYYHAFSHAIGSEDAFRDARDFEKFLQLVRARLGKEVTHDRFGRPQKSFHGEIELLAFCLMDNHTHLLIHQLEQPRAMTHLMISLNTAYAKYFNLRHERKGQLFQHPYSARKVEDHQTIRELVGYIHRNPKKHHDPLTYPYSSHRYYAGLAKADWCLSELGVRTFGSRSGYLTYMVDRAADPSPQPFD